MGQSKPIDDGNGRLPTENEIYAVSYVQRIVELVGRNRPMITYLAEMLAIEILHGEVPDDVIQLALREAGEDVGSAPD